MSPQDSEAFAKRIAELGNRNISAVLTDKADKDPEFRQRLLNSPKNTIAEVLGVSLPEDVKINVVQESATELWLVLPAVKGAGSTANVTPSAVTAGWKEK